MASKSRRPKGDDHTLFVLDLAIDGLKGTKQIVSIAPANAVLSLAIGLLTMIRVHSPDPHDEPLIYAYIGLYAQ